jgi:hypothetical protein
MAPADLFVSQQTSSHSAGISFTTHELFCPLVVLCGTWSKTSIAPSQMTPFWQSPRQNAFLSPVLAMFRHDCPPGDETCKYAMAPIPKQTWRDFLPIDMLLSAVSVLVVALLSSEVPKGLMYYPVLIANIKH